ncbi:STAS domain-containing protein [Streptomyces longispororuber]|uniref:STAS domain-containing protein n=1 Tax=Streptomyces longispororuber TaxID=68230 RepID=UPI002108AD90|nr:STAS domain-containing protein [Streptomyces longispororuber]MCQ4205690.1 STAS domain-containing protein [Streptomyces longispororuber]
MPDDSTFGLRIRRHGSPLVIELWGELDVLAAVRLSDRLLRLAAGARGVLVLDLRDVVFVDCSGLSMLLRVHRRLGLRHGHLTLVVVNPFHRRLLRLTHLDTVLHVVEEFDGDLPPGVRGTESVDSGAALIGTTGE